MSSILSPKFSIMIPKENRSHTQVSEFDLWMTLDSKMETSIMSPRENWSPPKFQNGDFYHDPKEKLISPTKFENLTIVDLDPRMVTSVMIPTENWSYHRRFRTWLMEVDPNSDFHHDPQGKLIPPPKFQNFTSGMLGWHLSENNRQPNTSLGQCFFQPSALIYLRQWK